jgi:anti-anti-sigma factor
MGFCRFWNEPCETAPAVKCSFRFAITCVKSKNTHERTKGSQMKTANAIEQREKDGITILDLKGKLTLGFENARLRAGLLSLLDAGTKNVVLNFHDISAIDTTGLATLDFCAMKFRDGGGQLALFNYPSTLGTVAEILKLNLMFEIHHDEVHAVNSFFPERRVLRYDILEFVECWRTSWKPTLAPA